MIRAIRSRLGGKLLLSHLIIVVVGVTVLAATAEIHAPAALSHHLERMQSLLGPDPSLAADLRQSFMAAVNEILAVAALAALLTAAVVSGFVTRRIVSPIRRMMHASQRIAAGDYHERVEHMGEDELGALAQAFNRMAQTLERTEQRRMELIGDVAHELRTPLSSIRAIMEGLVDGVLPAEPATLLEVQREVSRLQKLVHDLEELSRAEADQIQIHARAAAPADLVEAAVQRLEPQFADRGIELRVELPQGLPAVLADPERVVQVLLNLMGNGLQYTPSGGRVTVTARAAPREVTFTVRDTGQGIPAEHLPHIFERFYRVDRSRSRAGGGSGIGLTIAKHLVEAHGGRIQAESDGPGRGTALSFTLPVAPRLSSY